MTHIYHSPWNLFHAEMHVLFWIALVTGTLTVGFGLYVGYRFRQRRRSILMAGIHLVWAVFSWLWFWAMWYFWQVDWNVWRPHVAFWHFPVFLSAGVGLLTVTILGLILHHSPPRRGVTGRIFWVHGTLAIISLLLWGIGVWPYR